MKWMDSHMNLNLRLRQFLTEMLLDILQGHLMSELNGKITPVIAVLESSMLEQSRLPLHNGLKY
jgi:hypothetical protein